MPVIAFTDISIRALKPAEGKRVTYFDRSLKGFGIRLSGTGHASYVLLIGANRQRVKIGDVGKIKLADARNAARTMLAQKQLGVHQQHTSPTFAIALETFLEEKGKKRRSRTVNDYKRLLNRHGFGQEKLKDITPADVQKKLDKLKKTPSERAHAYAALQVFFRFCFRRHYLDRSPMERMEPPAGGKSRERVLTPNEIKKVWRACLGRFGGIVKLCLLTGQRRSEIAQIQLDWIQGDLLTIPGTVAKNRRENVVPLGPLALEVVGQHRNNSPYLFPATKLWKGKGTVYNAWGKDKPKLDQASGVTGWVLHDLRRTFSTLHAQIGTPPHVVEKLLNHITGTMTPIAAIYNRYEFLPEKHQAVVTYEQHLQAVLTS